MSASEKLFKPRLRVAFKQPELKNVKINAGKKRA